MKAFSQNYVYSEICIYIVYMALYHGLHLYLKRSRENKYVVIKHVGTRN